MTYLYFQTGHVGSDLLVVHVFLDVHGALDGLADDQHLLLVIAFLVIALILLGLSRPHDDHGIADELDDVAAELAEVLHHALHVAVDYKRQLLVASDSHP